MKTFKRWITFKGDPYPYGAGTIASKNEIECHWAVHELFD